MGASGSGKSTLLYVLGAIDKPTEGKIYIDGLELTSLKQAETSVLRRSKVGLIYQFYNLIPTLTVKENIILPLLLAKQKPDQAYYEHIIDILKLKDRLDFLPSQLSGGQQQRVAIARCLIYKPSIILADEPTGNLDRKHSEEIIELLETSNRSLGQTILLITHDEVTASKAKRIITISDGSIVADKSVNDNQ